MRWLLIRLIRLYQVGISPLSSGHCRFMPTCSQYAVEAVTEHGSLYGSWLMVQRLMKCGPWHPGGYDPVPARK